jgi:hypothetical protein
MTQIAFMVMPFGLKDVVGSAKDAPGRVDFDVLWESVHAPVLAELGYRPVRADCDVGALIINEMVQRLALADLVVADVSLPNANVYYEVGIRHAAKEHGCVLVGADWSKPVFDLNQMRRISYPLADGACGPDSAARARAALRESLAGMVRGRSPVFEAVPGYPEDVDPRRVAAFQDLVDALSAFQRDVTAIKRSVRAEDRRRRTERLLEEYGGSRTPVREAVVVQLIRLARDHLGPEVTLRYIRGLPEFLRRHPPVIEQEQIALAKTGNLVDAAAGLEELIRDVGRSSDRCGILGGRYKQLMKQADDDLERAEYLQRAIVAYEQGMYEDLNDYYPSSNLPRLYRLRDDPGDEQRAMEVAVVVEYACQRALADDPEDEWALLTQLGSAFDQGDGAQATQLVARIQRSRPARFHLDTTSQDLALSYRRQPAEVRASLDPAWERIEALLRATEHGADVDGGAVGGGPSVVRVDAVARIPDALDSVAIPRGRPVVVLVGGAGGMGDSGWATLGTTLREAVLPVVAELSATVVDGGTDAGVMRAIGRARHDVGGVFPLVGVAAEGTVTLPGRAPSSEGAAPLDTNHSHVVLVPGSSWGDESEWLARVATSCAGGRPSVTILVNGGEIAYSDVTNSFAEDRPVLVLAGTGRTAEAIADAARGITSDARAEGIARSALTRVLPVDDVSAVRSALDEVLRGSGSDRETP